MTAPSQEPLKPKSLCENCGEYPHDCSCKEINSRLEESRENLKDALKELNRMRSERDEARRTSTNAYDTFAITLTEKNKELESQSALIEKLKEGMGKIAPLIAIAITGIKFSSEETTPDIREHNLKKAIGHLEEALESARKVGM